MTKIPEIFSIFKDFMHFFPNFCQTLWIETLKRVNKEVMCYPVGLLEEISAVFYMTLSQIYTENYKDPRNFSIFKDFMHFFPNF